MTETERAEARERWRALLPAWTRAAERLEYVAAEPDDPEIDDLLARTEQSLHRLCRHTDALMEWCGVAWTELERLTARATGRELMPD